MVECEGKCEVDGREGEVVGSERLSGRIESRVEGGGEVIPSPYSNVG